MWKYMLICNGECDNDQQEFADSVKAGYQVARELRNPMFVDVSIDCYEYVVIYEDMPEDTDWASLIQDDGEGEYSL